MFKLPIFSSYSTLSRLVPKIKLLRIVEAVFTGWMPFLAPNHKQHQSGKGCL